MSAVFEAVGDLVEGVVDAVGDVVESVGDFVEDTVDFIGDTVQAVLDDPLPVLLSIAGSFVGIPPMVTQAAITASRGGDLGDIVLSAGTAYFAPTATNAISSTLSSTIGNSIVNETVSNAVVNGVSRGLVNGTIAEIRGGDFDDGFAGGFTGTLVQAGVTELTSYVQPEIASLATDLGFDASTTKLITDAGTKALTAGLTAEITDKGDFATSFTNSLVTTGINTTATSIANSVTNNVGDMFSEIETVDDEIFGADRGNVVDQDEIKTSLADAWENRDINAVNDLLTSNSLTAADTQVMFDLTDDDMTMLLDSGITFNSGDDIQTTTDLTNADTNTTVGTGAGIPDGLVDEVEVNTSTNGQDTGNAVNVVADAGDTFFSNDLGGTDSVATVSGSDTQSVTGSTQDTVSNQGDGWLSLSGYEDVSDIAETVGDDDVEVAEAVNLPEGFEDITEETAEAAPVVGGLTAVSDADDVAGAVVADTATAGTATKAPTTKDAFEGLDVGLDVAEGENAPVNIGGLNILEGGLNSAQGLVADPAKTGQNLVTGALNQFLRPAIKQGVSKALTRKLMPARQPPRQVRKPAPTRTALTPQQVTAMRKTSAPQKVDVSKLRPATTVAPKKVDVSKLTPVSDIASLTSMLAKKQG
jgi:hypothetical protein